jgi:hypothetical protein
MSANEIHVGDVGHRTTLTFKDGASAVDISGATTAQVWFRRPSGSVLKLDGTFTTDGSDGKLYVDSTASCFVSAGDTWEVQGYMKTATQTFHSDKTVFQVHDNTDR